MARWLLALAACALFVACAGPDRARVRLEQGGRSLELRVEVAATPEARRVGLMGRRALAGDAGMLFLFPGSPTPRSFWMKDTLIPLDIAFLRAGRVTEVRRMLPCRADPCPLTVSSQPADAALEVAAGTLARAGIGTEALFTVRGDLPPPV